MIQPFPYQQKCIDEIFDKFQVNNKILLQLPTGAGKTFVFSFITQAWSRMYGGKILILCHRTELINQTISSLNQIGVTCEAITSKVKQANHSAQCYVAMIETAHNRLAKNPHFFKNVALVIADECHLMLFDKVFNYFKTAKFLGCTATPIVYKRITFYKCSRCKTKYDTLTTCCDTEVIEWSRPFTMSEIYDDIVVGASIGELIEMGNLVQDINFSKKYADLNNLTIDAKTGDFSNESMDNAFNDSSTVFNVLLNYEELCKGKKTMIFNSTAKSNLLIYNKFIEAGYTNVKMFDSTNKCESRKSVVDWFKSTQDAVLLNVGVFTTGFDDTTVEVIMVNRATNSLSLWLQIVGRGGRSSKLIYKDKFIVIDGGGNIERHNEWSDTSRDWRRIFFEGLGDDREKSKKVSLEDVQACDGCGYLMPKTIDKCPECGFVIPPPKPREIKEGDTIVMPIKNIPPPNGEKIYLYTLAQGEDLNFAWRILINQIYDMFVFYRVSKEAYSKSLASGELHKKVKKMITACYFVLKSKSDISSGTERTIQYLINKVLKKLEERYEKN